GREVPFWARTRWGLRRASGNGLPAGWSGCCASRSAGGRNDRRGFARPYLGKKTRLSRGSRIAGGRYVAPARMPTQTGAAIALPVALADIKLLTQVDEAHEPLPDRDQTSCGVHLERREPGRAHHKICTTITSRGVAVDQNRLTDQS